MSWSMVTTSLKISLNFTLSMILGTIKVKKILLSVGYYYIFFLIGEIAFRLLRGLGPPVFVVMIYCVFIVDYGLR